MNILFLSICYSERDNINFYEELLQEFVGRGHNVYVACANERRNGRNTTLTKERDISVLRIKIGNITGNVNIIEKGLSTVLIDYFFKKAIKKFYKCIDFDMLIYPTPPITLAGTVYYLKKKCRATTYLLLKDIFPQNAVDLNMLSTRGTKGIIYKAFRKKEKKLYEVSDFIGCMSPANVNYVLLHNKNVNKDKLEVCPNCVKPIVYKYSEEELKKIRIKYCLPLSKKIFVYGGNLGKPQGIGFFLQCLKQCKYNDEACFLIVGGGSEANKIKKFIRENSIKNAKILDTLPKSDYEILVASCDVGLIFLDYRFTIPNFPSRILSYMQNAKPVIVATDPNTDMGDIVEKNGFGWKCLSNNIKEFDKCVEKAIHSDLKSMGYIGRKFLEENYSVEKGCDIIMKHFNT
jgi:hypothetical protein